MIPRVSVPCPSIFVSPLVCLPAHKTMLQAVQQRVQYDVDPAGYQKYQEQFGSTLPSSVRKTSTKDSVGTTLSHFGHRVADLFHHHDKAAEAAAAAQAAAAQQQAEQAQLAQQQAEQAQLAQQQAQQQAQWQPGQYRAPGPQTTILPFLPLYTLPPPPQLAQLAANPADPVFQAMRTEYMIGCVMAQVDTRIIFDDSGSMHEGGHDYSVRRLDEAKEAVADIINVSFKYSTNPIRLYTLNEGSERTFVPGQDPWALLKPLSASGGTPLGASLHSVVEPYIRGLPNLPRNSVQPPLQLARKPLNVIVITDGEANDEHLIKSTIKHAVHELEVKGYHPSHQVGVHILQVGDDHGARRFLEKLDDHFKDDEDIVKLTPHDPNDRKPLIQVVYELLLGGLNEVNILPQ